MGCISAAPRRWWAVTASSRSWERCPRRMASLLSRWLPVRTNHPIFPFTSLSSRIESLTVLYLLSIFMLSPPRLCRTLHLLCLIRAWARPPPLLLQCRVMDAHGLYAYLLHAVDSYYVSAWRHSRMRNEIGRRLEGRREKNTTQTRQLSTYIVYDLKSKLICSMS